MNKNLLLAAASSLVLLSACASRTPYLDTRFGEAVNTAKAMQTINPQASRNTDPVAGLDGPSAKESIGRYHDSFKAPAETFEVIGGGTTGR
jgi:hypothetical protein